MHSVCKQDVPVQRIDGKIGSLETVTIRIEKSVVRMAEEFSTLTTELRNVLIEEREVKLRLEAAAKAQDEAFMQIREARTDVEAIHIWKSKIEGSLLTLKYLPVACTIISAICALLAAQGPTE